MEHHAPPSLHAPTACHVRAAIPAELRARVAHLAIDRRMTVQDLIVEGLVLLCRYHELGDGLPEPELPTTEDSGT